MIEDTNTQSQLNRTLKNVWPDGSGVLLWIDGVKDVSDNKWYYYSSGSKTPASTDLNWFRGAAIESGCLLTSGVDSISFRAGGKRCAYQGLSVVCEYRDRNSKAAEIR